MNSYISNEQFQKLNQIESHPLKNFCAPGMRSLLSWTHIAPPIRNNLKIAKNAQSFKTTTQQK